MFGFCAGCANAGTLPASRLRRVILVTVFTATRLQPGAGQWMATAAANTCSASEGGSSPMRSGSGILIQARQRIISKSGLGSQSGRSVACSYYTDGCRMAQSQVPGSATGMRVSPSKDGDGPYVPVATNKTEEGRAKNRRVELVEIATR